MPEAPWYRYPRDMFTSPRRNLYESSDGFSVEVLGRTGLRYREAGRQMFVDSEVLTGPSGMAVYKDTIQKWDPPYENVPVTDSDRDRILNNIRDAFRFEGFEIDVI
jgi:immunity protein 74 of polymorphic toxin system